MRPLVLDKGLIDKSPRSAIGFQEAQEQAATGQAKPMMTMKEVKQKLGIVVFPAKGQTPEQQEKDEYDCPVWAAEQAGITFSSFKDPNAAGQAVKGAAKGAAVGAIFGAIVGDSGEGAAIGAVGGALAGRRAKKQVTAQAEAQAKAHVDAENKAKLDAIRKGMTACLESKGYTIK